MTDPHAPLPERLLAEFPLPEPGAWRAEAERLLKGAPFAEALVTRTLEGLATVPMATAADTADLSWLDSLPGQAPFVRGATAAGHLATPWLVAQELLLPEPVDFNAALIDDLERGQTAAHLVLDAAGRGGLDPADAPATAVGHEGTSVADLADLDAALAGVDLAATPVLLRAGASGLPAAALLAALAGRRGTATADLRGLAGGDPLAVWAATGALPRPLARLRAEQAALTAWARSEAPRLRTLPILEDPWHDGGADGALSLALVLAGAVDLLRDLEAAGLDPAAAAPRVQFHLCLGSDFFLEIARLRVLRLVWSRVQEAAGLAPQPAWIHARTSRRTQTVHDPHVNLLRATTQALSGVLGGVQSLHVAPFDEVDSLPDAFGRRIARNIQLLLLHEAHADRVADPAGGSWYVERLTADLAEAVWARFQEIEAAGGLAAGLRAGAVQDRVAAAAAERRQRLAVRRDVIVGTNRYADPAERARVPRRPDHAALARRRADAVAGRATPLPPAPDLPARLGDEPVAAVEALIAAAVGGASLGALNGALAAGDPTAGVITPVPRRRDAEPFEALRARVAALAAADPARGRVACACLGSLPRTLPRLDFTRGFFRVAGFEVVDGDFHDDPEAAARAALATGAATVVLVALDEVYARDGEQLARALKAVTPPPRVLLAGRPKEQQAVLAAAGVDAFVHARSDVPAVLGTLIDQLEGTR